MNDKFGHGWVTPRPDGAKARCGGPALCKICQAEAAALAAAPSTTPDVQQEAPLGQLYARLDEIRARLDAQAAATNYVAPSTSPAAAAVAGEPDNWEGAEGWEPLAWALCAEENGEEACNELIWEGGPQPEPWGDRWLKYEGEAKRMIELVRKHCAPHPSPSAAEQQCACKDRPKAQCPGEWEPGCDLGNNPAHVRVRHLTPDEQALMKRALFKSATVLDSTSASPSEAPAADFLFTPGEKTAFRADLVARWPEPARAEMTGKLYAHPAPAVERGVSEERITPEMVQAGLAAWKGSATREVNVGGSITSSRVSKRMDTASRLKAAYRAMSAQSLSTAGKEQAATQETPDEHR